MRYRLLGRTGLYVSEICLGTMTWGGKGFWQVIGQLPLDDVKKQLKASLDAGVNFIDSADVYHEGLSEQRLGDAIRELGLKRSDLVIATKVRGRAGPGPNDIGLSRKHIFDSVEGSLRRLGTDHIDLYQIHGVDVMTPPDETMRALDDLVRQGKVRYLGASNLAAWQIVKANGLASAFHGARFESVQAYWTIASRDLEREIVPMAQSEQIGILVWSPLAGGLLSGKFADSKAPADSRRAQFDFPPVDKDRAARIVEVMRPIAASHGVSVAQVALGWLLSKSATTSVIIGAKTQEQLEDNLASAKLQLTAEDLAALETISAYTPEYPQ
jgi:aryl-alcohol dehydrogenase-like predicted oxidoreductase